MAGRRGSKAFPALVTVVTLALVWTHGGVQPNEDTAPADVPLRAGPGPLEGTGGGAFLARAGAATTRLETASYQVSFESKGGSHGISETVGLIGLNGRATGEINTKEQLRHFRLNTGATLGRTGGGPGDGMDVLEVVVEGTTSYRRAPLTDLAEAGKPWTKVLATAGAVEPGGLMNEDPRTYLGLLKGASGAIDLVDRQDLRGVATIHVTATLEMAKVWPKLSVGERTLLTTELDLGSIGGSKAVTQLEVEAWVDLGGHVRQLVFHTGGTVGKGSGRSGLSTDITVELFEFGEPVNIVVPPPALIGAVEGD